MIKRKKKILYIVYDNINVYKKIIILTLYSGID